MSTILHFGQIQKDHIVVSKRKRALAREVSNSFFHGYDQHVYADSWYGYAGLW